MRRLLLAAAAAALVAGCGRTGDALFKKLPDGPTPDALVVLLPDAVVDGGPYDCVIGGPPSEQCVRALP